MSDSSEADHVAKVARAWTIKWSEGRGAEEGDNSLEDELDFILPRKNPVLCLAVIEHVLTLIPAEPSNKLFGALAAGPLENLITGKGDVVIDQVDALARTSPAFRKLLNGAWLSGARPQVLARLQKYLIDRW